MRARRTLPSATAFVAVSLLLVGSAWAHGGAFRGPPGQLPPGLRPPTDPIPPPPPPPSGPPPTTHAPSSPRPSPPPVTPSAPSPTTGPALPQPGTRSPGGARTPISYEDWTYWYHNNNESIENLKRALYTPVDDLNPLHQVGGQDEENRSSATRPTAKKVREVVIPALLWAMDPRNARHQDTESAAYIALAKVTTDPRHVAVIMRGLDKSLKNRQIVQESAALALGLLRRADKADQFEAIELDKVRAFLFDVFRDKGHPTRVRGFAALGIGLLGDQPTGSGAYATDRLAAAQRTTADLFGLLEGPYAHTDLYVAPLLAIGMQSPASLDKAQRDALADCVTRGRLGRENVNDVIRSYAALALGRIGTAADRGVLENALLARRGVGTHVQRSSAIGLGRLGRLVEGADRVAVVEVLLKGIDRVKENTTVNFSIMALSDLLVEEAMAGSTTVMDASRADELLLEVAADGKYLHKPFGALAIALVARHVTEDVDVDALQTFREKAIQVLRAGVEARGGDKRTRAAFCVGLGIARDMGGRESLRKIVADTKEDKDLRGYAALGLGLLGRGPPEVAATLARALQERSSEELRRQAAVALGLMGNPKVSGTGKSAVDLLLDELQEARTQNHKGQIVLALARIGDHRAVDRLVDLLKNGTEDLTRALACAGLGLIGDLEWIPSLTRISEDINYRASGELIDEVLSIL